MGAKPKRNRGGARYPQRKGASRVVKVVGMEVVSHNRRRARSRADYSTNLDVLHTYWSRGNALIIAWARSWQSRDAWCNLVHIFVGAAAIFVGTCFWWVVLDREPPVEMISGTIEPNPAAPGAVIRIHMMFREHRVCAGDIQRRIIDNSGEVHTYVDTNTVYINETPANEVTIDREFPIPSSIHPGTWAYAPIVKWYCNPAQRWFNQPIVVVQKHIPFDVQGVPPALQEQLDNKVQKHLEYVPLPRANPHAVRMARGTY